MSLQSLVYIVLVTSFGSCSMQKIHKSSSFADHKQRIYIKERKEYVTPTNQIDIKKWERDSLVIIEGMALDIDIDSANNEKWNVYISRYVFIDLRKRSFYTYLNFSDTAIFVKKYSFYDKGSIDDKWNFFDTTSFMTSNKHFKISDTIVNGVNYSRYQVHSMHTDNGESYLNIRTAYLRCDITNFILSLDKPFSRLTGCFVSKFDDWQPGRVKGLITEMEIRQNNLGELENKVFDAWEKNAKENPVTPKK